MPINDETNIYKGILDKDPFIAALEKEDLDLITKFINKDNINIKTINGYTPLIFACSKQNFELAKLIIENNPNLDEKCSKGFTALMHSCNHKNKDIVELLIASGCNLNTTNDDIDMLDFCVNVNIVSLINMARNKIQGNTKIIECKQCQTKFTVLNNYNNENICNNCSSDELKGFLENVKISMSPKELLSINKNKSKNSSPVVVSGSPIAGAGSPIMTSSSPTFGPVSFVDISGVLPNIKIPEKSVNYMRCPGCKEQRIMNKDNCLNCQRKSPICR